MHWTSRQRFKAGLYPRQAPIGGTHRRNSSNKLIVSVWCGAARFAHADITRLDATLVRLFDWGHAAGHKAIVRLFQRFDQPSASRVQASSYRWLFDKLRLFPITLDVDSTVLTRWGSQIEGGAKGYNPKNRGRASHHPLLAFVADWRLVANFWLRPGNTSSSNNILSFIESTLENLGTTKVGLFRADSGFYDKAIVALLNAKGISHIISARLTQALQQAIVENCQWQQVAPGLEVSELAYQPHDLGQYPANRGGTPARAAQGGLGGGQDFVTVCR